MRLKQPTLSALLILALGFVGGLVISGRLSLTAPSNAAPAQAAAPLQRPTVSLPMASSLPDLSIVAEAALRAAANISSTTTVRTNDLFTQFFNGGRPRTERSQSLGSGVVVSPDGYILTNNHVIGDAASADVRVTLADHVERPARLIGVDDVSDLALLKVDANDLQTLPWGDSSKLRIAEWVLAIGNPYQLSGTVTLGIVSAVSRSGAEVGAYANVIQTDAAINPGNSGGALVNARGELVGINSMIYSRTGGYQGIGFAIPANDAKKIMADLRTNGSVSWGDIGYVEWYDFDQATARRYGFGNVEGVLVYDLTADSSAFKAGLRPDDIVIAFNGQKVTTYETLQRRLVAAPVGSRARFEVIRSGRSMTLDIPIVKRQAPGTRTR